MQLKTLDVTRIQGHVTGLSGAAAGQTQRAGILVRLRDDEGGWGQGEASPLPGFSPDTLDACVEQLRAVAIDKLAPESNVETDHWLDRALAASGIAAPAARFALETVLLDWWGRRTGVSVAALLAGDQALTRRIPLAVLVDDFSSAQAAFARGIRSFKIKISPAMWSAALRLAEALRREYGASVALRFDANGSLSVSDAAVRLRELSVLTPEFIEEPVAGDNLARLVDMPLPLAADESLARPGAWPQLAGVCRVLVLKPTLLGGLRACFKLAHDAVARDLSVVVTHTFDGPIALAAAAELAVALPGRVLACGLDPHPGLAVWPAVEIPQVHADHIASANLPGLGLRDFAL
jgi:o-succinylbenzoate synthase